MTESDMMRLINAYAAAYNRTNSKIDRAAAREILSAIQAYGDERVEQRQKEDACRRIGKRLAKP